MLWRTTYLLVLIIAFTQLLARNPSLEVVGDEEPWVWVTVTALVVRETVIVSGGLWELGRSQWLLIRFWWRLRFRVSRRVSGGKKRLKAPRCDPEAERLARELFPEQPADYFTWPELLALAALKVGIKGLFELMPEETCANIFLKVRWAQGLRCVYCGCRKLKVKEHDYHLYYRRYECLSCGRTFNDKSRTIFANSHLAMREWLWGIHLFVTGKSAEHMAQELGCNRKTGQRLRRLLQLSLFTQRFAWALHGPVEIDEIYIISGLKGRAGGLALNRPPRRRGLKKRGRGDWQGDKPPVLGLVDRQGQVYLIVLANVQTQTIQPFIERLVARGAQVYTDEYSIYRFLKRSGYLHETVNHSRKEYARGKAHVNGVEGLWSLVRSYLRPYRGLSKVYLPLYLAHIEFQHNRRDLNDWALLIEVLVRGVKADGPRLRRHVREGTVTSLCPIPGLAAA
jgi:transposase-like protein